MATYPLTRIDALTPGRNRSADLWRGAREQYGNDPKVGSAFVDDFVRPHNNSAVGYADGWYVGEAGTAGATGESFATTGAADGVCSLAATTGTDLQGVQAQAGVSATVGEGIVTCKNANGKGDLIFEARIKLTDAAADTFFIGLAEPSAAANTLLLNDNTLSLALDYIGFYRLDGGDIQFVCRNDNNGGTAVAFAEDVIADADAPTASDWIKLGFRVNADGSVEVFVDEVRVHKTSDDGDDIVISQDAVPIELLTRTIAVARGSTADNGTVGIDVDWIDAYVAE